MHTATTFYVVDKNVFPNNEKKVGKSVILCYLVTNNSHFKQ